jgi:glycine/D-amino acid oxidase-like deaminating enzyme
VIVRSPYSIPKGSAGALQVLPQDSCILTSAKQIAQEALGETVVIQTGIIRHVQSEEQNQLFLAHAKEFGDVTSLGNNKFCIESGMTIDCPRYLEGLWQAIAAHGGKLILREISELSELSEFDHVIVAAGAGVKRFPELSALRFSILKGQILDCRIPETEPIFEQSMIGKGYIAMSQNSRLCHVGSTYERDVVDDVPNVETAKKLIFPNVSLFFPDVEKLEIVDCKAALRVKRANHYFPIAEQVKDNLWVLMAMGSRGLLYHAYLGRLLADAVMKGDWRPLRLVGP